MKSNDYLDIAYRLYLECALSASVCGLNVFSHGFITKGALTMYEEDQMSKNGVEYNSLRLLIATVNQIECFDRYQSLYFFIHRFSLNDIPTFTIKNIFLIIIYY